MATRKKVPAKKVSHAKVPAKKKPAPAKKVSHAKVVVKKKTPAKKAPVKKIVLKKKPPAKKKKVKIGKIEAPGRVPVFTRGKIEAPPPRKTRQIPIGGIAHMIDTSGRKPPPAREEMPVSEHWSYFDRDTGEPVAPWEIDVGPEYDDEEGGTPFESGEIFADEDYSYADIEADWGGYDHTDTGYGDENA